LPIKRNIGEQKLKLQAALKAYTEKIATAKAKVEIPLEAVRKEVCFLLLYCFL
jgi:hypothetical protein